MTTLAKLEGRFNRLYRACLILRIAYLESLLEQRAAGWDEVEFDLRKLTPDERAAVLAIHTNMQARETREP